MPVSLPDPSDIDAWLEVVSDADRAGAAIRSESCPEKAMERALQLFPDLDSQIIYNPATPSYILEAIYKRAGYSGTRSSVVQHKNATEVIWELASQDSDKSVRRGVAERIKSSATLEKLAQDSEQSVRYGVAENPHTPSSVLEILTNPIEIYIAAAVLKHKNCTPEIFRTIAKGEIDSDWLPEPLLSLAPKELILDIYNRAPQSKRYYILKNPLAPETLLLELLEQAAPQEAYSALVNSIPFLLKREEISQELFLALLKSAPETTLFQFAGYKNHSQASVDAIIAKKSVELKISLIGNSSIHGDMLLSLIGDKSKKVQSALREKTYFGHHPDGSFKALPYENRDSLWAALESGAAAPSKKKLTQNSAIEEIFSSNFTKNEFEEVSQLYLESTSAKSFEPTNPHPWLAAASSSDQRNRIIACVRVRAAQLGILKPESLRDEPYFYVMPRFEGAVFKYLMDPFFETLDDLNYRIIKSLGELNRIIVGGYSKIPNLQKSHILELIELKDPYFNWVVANNYPLDADVLTALAPSLAYRHSTYKEESDSSKLKFGERAFYSSSGYRIESHPAAIVAVHPETPADVIDKLRKSSNQYIRGLFIEDDRLYSDEALKRGMKDKSEYVRALVAAHPNTTPEMLETLASDKDVTVRTAVKANPRTPKEVKAMMALLKD
jgi:hypothetical protein